MTGPDAKVYSPRTIASRFLSGKAATTFTVLSSAPLGANTIMLVSERAPMVTSVEWKKTLKISSRFPPLIVTGLPLSSGPESGSRVGPTHSLNEQPSKSSSAQHRLEPQTGRSIITFFEMSWMIDRRQTQTTDRQQSDMQVLVSSINGVTLGNGCFQTAQLSISIIMGPGLLLSACLGPSEDRSLRSSNQRPPISHTVAQIAAQ